MTKYKKYVVTLILPGNIIQDLHFGAFSRNWWLSRPDDNSTCLSLYSIRVGMKTLTTINNKDFIITVVQNNEFKPSYICQSDGIYSKICENSTTAITSVYQRIFSVATKHAGPLIMGFDQHIISDQLLSDITFRPFSFKLDKLNLLIFVLENLIILNGIIVKKVRVYQATQEVAMFKNTSPNTIWQQIGILSQYTELELFGLAHKITYEAIKEIPSCTSLDWNNEIFEKVFQYHLKRRLSPNINWRKFFISWSKQNHIIELHQKLKEIYSKEQVIEEREWRAWKALLNHCGCTEITPYSKEQSDFEFWTRSENPNYDKAILKTLANKFTYNEIQANLKVSTDAITYARHFAQNYGPDGHQWEKPIIKHEKMDPKKKEQLEKFFQDKAVVIMSSYKTDNSTNQPVHYLKNTKQVLWNKFHETFPDGVKRTSFYGYLQGNRFVYHENMGGLCSICSIHGYKTFDEFNRLIKCYVFNSSIQDELITACEKLSRFLKKDYEQEIIIDSDGITKHNPCLNHCMLYAFGYCTESHTYECYNCNSLFRFIDNIKRTGNTDLSIHGEIEELKDHLLCYLS
ncbi:hypothetical protein C2G38_2179769 [Gigaspora rosea]|uniref:Uncharacterized protein n=1 Tax=Gigaspora rosea TaxID=44941 RepID=A0A397VCR6_9GLOM|nr:hypothetical protein C2G38_2179769 [Gigaspora rosea]